ncbi:DNA alkylation repair protein [Pragia fontium]|uniref:3-methyladenine DNA glycosylase AlkC n=1 Tax=Pragia fontium DSM 5563 = ATCC 49100 TaxID=1122977 RepID=A0AAJ4WAK3_9GAMM|nr:DNA alkylation repair protein [Pragia fontium]SFC81144.1 3-methyladenine DNA glycosylase AlkC [Pragia fontium DSM 5563 = ATCC 49100]VEJ55541.1 DNA alkylation repair enzyme [Pragia fontium]
MAKAETGHKKYYNSECAQIIAEMINPLHQIDTNDYASKVQTKIGPLELKDRVYVLADELRKQLPQDYPTAINIIVDSLGDELAEDAGMFNEGWYLMPIARFVEEFGLSFPEASLSALAEITKRHTAEYAVRPFIQQHYEYTMGTLGEWARSSNFHLRRAASEGIRPRLPWAPKLQCFIDDPKPVLAILEILRSDPSDYVRKSVGNNLNDISKDWPDLIIETLERWKSESSTPETTQIIKRALRSLIKAGNQKALTLIGATGGEIIEVSHFDITPKEIQLGESIKMEVAMINPDTAHHDLTVEYIIHHVRHNGRTIPKAFRLASLKLNAHETKHISKTHAVKAVGVRAYYAGHHRVDIVVNGQLKASSAFELKI